MKTKERLDEIDKFSDNLQMERCYMISITDPIFNEAREIYKDYDEWLGMVNNNLSTNEWYCVTSHKTEPCYYGVCIYQIINGTAVVHTLITKKEYRHLMQASVMLASVALADSVKKVKVLVPDAFMTYYKDFLLGQDLHLVMGNKIPDERREGMSMYPFTSVKKDIDLSPLDCVNFLDTLKNAFAKQCDNPVSKENWEKDIKPMMDLTQKYLLQYGIFLTTGIQ